MGQLIEQDIPALYNGVSRQPDQIRLTSQHQDADNVAFSIVTGGFEKRDAAAHVGTLATFDLTEDWVFHPVDRDETEKYLIGIAGDGEVRVIDATTGTERTVTVDAGTASAITAYLAAGSAHPSQVLAMTTQVDVTIVVNRTVTAAMLSGTPGTLTGSVATEADLPGTPSDGQIYEITGTSTALDNYYVKWVAADSRWVEVADPRIDNSFDPDTMPIKITRQAGGAFLVEQIAWDDRPVGDLTTVPNPTFIGNSIKDVFFYRNRLGFLSDTNVYFSQANDFYNLWPDRATVVLDSDPIDLSVQSSRVSLLKWALPFRKTLFLTSDRAQFEMGGSGILTPNTAAIDETTTYSSPNYCRPVVMGSELYFASELSGAGIVYEYYFDEATLSNTADNVTKHALGYVPREIRRLVAESTSETLFALCGYGGSDIYPYTVYWNGTEKVQSAWGKWSFSGEILDIAVIGEELFVLLKDGSNLVVCKVIPSNTDTDAGFSVRLDRKVSLTGTYDAPSNTTTWTIPYGHKDAVVGVLSSDFSQAGRQLSLTYDGGGADVSATGDWSGGDVIFGLRYTSRVKLSRLYARGQDNKAYLQGRTQIRRMRLWFTDTGYFKVTVTPTGRSAKEYVFTGRNVSVLNNIIDRVTLTSSSFSIGVKSKADTVGIEISSDSYLPMQINQASWSGFYNNIVRQG